MPDKTSEPVVERMTDPDPFDLARRVSGELECTCNKGNCNDDAAYLWLYVSKEGISQREDKPSENAPTLEHWLNAVDEAAGAGVQSLVVSIDAPLERFPQVWEICRWAQDTHQMIIGVHVFEDVLAEDAVEAIESLDLTRTRVFASTAVIEHLKPLQKNGIQLHIAEPNHDPSVGECTLPSRMVFVNPEGVLYTCGMVEGNEAYRLGTIFEGSFAKIIQDAALPHAVPGSDATNPRGCDGCPPMLSRFFEVQ